jgi:hypothetical protein
MMAKTYIEIVRLLLESAPAIFETPHFAMKGGTALNLFIESPSQEIQSAEIRTTSTRIAGADFVRK